MPEEAVLQENGRRYTAMAAMPCRVTHRYILATEELWLIVRVSHLRVESRDDELYGMEKRNR